MAFDNLKDRLSDIFKNLRKKGKLSEDDVKVAMREIRVALLEADVNFKVAKDFVKSVSEKAVGEQVLESLTPGQQVIKIVNEELCALMGGENEKIKFSDSPPTVIMLVGLQGTGKTTTCAKLSGILKKQGKRPMLVACDVYRPAAVKQLITVGSSFNVPVYYEEDSKEPVKIAKNAIEKAKRDLNDVVIIDTAGRLHIDEDLMAELEAIKESVKPTEILLVIDAMTGQDALNFATKFDERLDITGVIVTKLDGDARGGSVLSVKAITGKSVKYVGMGEKLNELEPFYPDRMASRILGMGDVLTLIEKAEEAFDLKKAQELEKKMKTKTFTFTDFLDQIDQIKNLGPIENILGMLPGVNKKALAGVKIPENQFDKTKAIILSMTLKERENPSIINLSRKERIAKGSGTSVPEVNALLKQFEQMKKMMKQFSGKKLPKHFRGMF
ncbi:MAG: signal recognition particle protein [Ruminococcaceae bacterium]|nr:signal recognition particle protein [Oscillospiraceae bacterium]